MKKLIICLSMISLLVFLGGCGGKIPDMSDDQREAISEYAVGLLLKYNTDQSGRLVDLSLLEEKEETDITEEPVVTPEPTQKPEATPIPEEDMGTAGLESVEDEPVKPEEDEKIYADLGETLLLPEGISLEYADYQVAAHYTDTQNKGLTLDAKDGYSFLVVRCFLLNSGSDKQVVDMMQTNVKHSVIVNGTSVNAMVTLLSNDMITYMGELAADESKEVVMLAEIETNLLEDVETISVEFARDEMISGIIIK